MQGVDVDADDGVCLCSKILSISLYSWEKRVNGCTYIIYYFKVDSS